ncbi:MAG: PAS domain S-box protein [Flavitalea sp.]
MENNQDKKDSICSQTFRSLVESGSDLVGIIDVEGNYLFVSPSCEHILGFTSEYFIGKNAFEFIHPEDVPHALEALNNLFCQKTIHLKPFRFKNSGGEWRWIETVATNQLENSLINGIVVNSRDITEKKKSEERQRLLAMHEQEEVQRRITEAVILAQEQERNIISLELHDNVCQLLTTAKLYLDLVKDQSDKVHPMIYDTLEIIKLSINQVRDISHALSYSTLGEAPFRDSLEQLIRHVNGALKTEFQLEIIDLDDSLLSCGLKLSIYRIIQEQINNILKHSDAPEACVRLQQSEGQLFLTISDNGSGFDPAVRKNGMGLNNIRSRVNAYGGKLQLQTTPGKGCYLQIEFDLCGTCTEK